MPTTEVDSDEEKRNKRRAYMREYRRKYCAKNKKALSDYNKVNYLVHKKGLNKDQVKDVTVMKADFAKIIVLFDKIKEEYPLELKDFVMTYVEDIEVGV